MRLVPALDRGLRILDLLARQRRRIKVSEIAELLDIPRSATYELISTLAAHNAIIQHENGEVGLGPQTLLLGSAFNSDLDFSQIAQSEAHDLMQTCQETVQVGILTDRHVLYITKAEPSHLVRLVSTVGARLPAHCTALGKVLLAYLSDAEQQSRLARVPLEKLTENSIHDWAQLRTHLMEVRSQGYASEQCESNTDVACVAAPVWDAVGSNVAALSVAVPLARMTQSRAVELRAAVMDSAARISRRLGHGG